MTAGARLAALVAICLLITLPGQQARAQLPLVADIAERVVKISYAFSGAQLLVFGASDCDPQADTPCHLIAVIEGPPTPLVVRRKERMNGIWINATAARYPQAPGYFGVAASAPLKETTSPALAAQLGIEYQTAFVDMQAADISAEDIEDFNQGLIEDRQDRQLYLSEQPAIEVEQGRLFRMTFPAPATVPIGQYDIKIYAIMDGEIVGETRKQLSVRKDGAEAFISRAASTSPVAYGLLSICLALGIGFVSATLFKK